MTTEKLEHSFSEQRKALIVSNVFAQEFRREPAMFLTNLQNFFVSSNLFSRCPIRIAQERTMGKKFLPMLSKEQQFHFSFKNPMASRFLPLEKIWRAVERSQLTKFFCEFKRPVSSSFFFLRKRERWSVGKNFLPTEKLEYSFLKQRKALIVSNVFAQEFRREPTMLLTNMQNFFAC